MQHPLCRLQLAVFLSFQLEFAFFFLGGKTSAIFKTEDIAVIVRSFVPNSNSPFSSSGGKTSAIFKTEDKAVSTRLDSTRPSRHLHD